MTLRALAILRNDWKWYSALALLAVLAIYVACFPRPCRSLPSRVSVASPAGASSPTGPAAGAHPEPVEDFLQYTAQEGDTVKGIAKLFVVREDDFRTVNGLAPGEEVVPGQSVRIPPAAEIPQPSD